MLSVCTAITCHEKNLDFDALNVKIMLRWLYRFFDRFNLVGFNYFCHRFHRLTRILKASTPLSAFNGISYREVHEGREDGTGELFCVFGVVGFSTALSWWGLALIPKF